MRTFHIGEVYYMKFIGDGSEQFGWRPGVVVQNNKASQYSPNLIVVPVTSSIKKIHQPTHVFLSKYDSGMKRDCMVLCENPQRMSKSNVGGFITTLPVKYLKEIAISSLLASSIISFISLDDLIDTWEMATVLNNHWHGGLYVQRAVQNKVSL